MSTPNLVSTARDDLPHESHTFSKHVDLSLVCTVGRTCGVKNHGPAHFINERQHQVAKDR